MQKVTVALGPDKGRVFNLSPGSPVQIGRRGAQVLLTDHNISRQHAQFLFKDDKWWVIDLGSTNGTMVNGIRITQAAALKGGDQVQIGRSTLIFHGKPASQRKDRPDRPGTTRLPAPATVPAAPVAQTMTRSTAPPPPPEAPPESPPDPPDTDGPEQVAMDVLSRQKETRSTNGREIDAEALDDLEQYIRQGRANRPRDPRQTASSGDVENTADRWPSPKPVPNATVPAPDDQIIPTLDMPHSSLADAAVEKDSTHNIAPPLADPPLEVHDVSAQPVQPLEESSKHELAPQPVDTADNTTDTAPAQIEVEYAASAWMDDDIAAPQDNDHPPDNVVTVAVGVIDDQPKDTAAVSHDQLPQVDPTRILAIEFDEDSPVSDVATEAGSPPSASLPSAHVLANSNEDRICASLTDDAQFPANEQEQDAQSSHELPTEAAIGAVELNTFDITGSIDAANDLGTVEEQFTGSALTDAANDPLYPYDIGSEFAYAASTTTDTALIDPEQESDACATLAVTTLAMPVEAEPQIGIVPLDEEDEDLDDDLPRPAPQTVTILEPEATTPLAPQMPVEVEAEPESEPEAESEPEPAPEPEPTPQPVIEKEPAPVVEHQPPAKAQPPSFSPTPQFKRRPAKPGMLIEPDVEFDHQVKEEEYDYYAWEERQSNILHRGVKIGFFILIGVSALVFAGTQAVYIWMQFTGNSKHAPTPAIVEKIPAKQVESLADPVVDPLDNIPDSSQDNITNVLDAMNKQVDKLDKESKE